MKWEGIWGSVSFFCISVSVCLQCWLERELTRRQPRFSATTVFSDSIPHSPRATSLTMPFPWDDICLFIQGGAVGGHAYRPPLHHHLDLSLQQLICWMRLGGSPRIFAPWYRKGGVSLPPSSLRQHLLLPRGSFSLLSSETSYCRLKKPPPLKSPNSNLQNPWIFYFTR